MKSFFQFLNEATGATEQAKRLGLVGDGHGGWYDRKGEFIAKTEGGKLKFYNKRQVVGGKDKPSTPKEKEIASPNYRDPNAPDQQVAAQPAPVEQPPVEQQPAAPEAAPAPAAAAAPVGPPPVPKTKGTLTIAFGRFNPPICTTNELCLEFL